ncbi:MAG TPA: Gfo/Idh/MocA family oxidoreductase [Gaiellaceae bacterium]|nr:Gfo/Idh/MocA family oxidoreductase [Gaiellaceae bacterium]
MLRVGVVGCGIIARRYVEDSPAFEHWRPVACTDLDESCRDAFAAAHGLRALTFDELIAEPEVDAILSLTPPKAHYPIASAALAAGKHVYTEKPLSASLDDARRLLDEANEAGLRLACAPDTFLGSAYQTGKRLIDEGRIGQPLGANATMLVGGPDSWHPNAEMFYRAGGGPLLDIAPYYITAIVALLGRVADVAGFVETPTPERTLGAGAAAGSTITVDVPTHSATVLRLVSGALATLTVSFEARNQYLSGLTVYGTEGSLVLPDANGFGGEIQLRNGRAGEAVAYETYGAKECRGLGLEDLAVAIEEGREHQASGELALHVLETAVAAEGGG